MSFSSKVPEQSVEACHMINMAMGEENPGKLLRGHTSLEEIPNCAIAGIKKKVGLIRSHKDLRG
jgi:hypothetical protein